MKLPVITDTTLRHERHQLMLAAHADAKWYRRFLHRNRFHHRLSKVIPIQLV